MWILNWSGYVNTSCIYQYFQYQYEKAKYYLDRVTLLTVFCKNVLFTYKTQSKSNGFGCFTTWNVYISIQLTILQILHLRNIWIWYWNHGTVFHHELECSLMNGTAIAFLDLLSIETRRDFPLNLQTLRGNSSILLTAIALNDMKTYCYFSLFYKTCTRDLNCS